MANIYKRTVLPKLIYILSTAYIRSKDAIACPYPRLDGQGGGNKEAGLFLDWKVTMCRRDDRRNSRRDSLHDDCLVWTFSRSLRRPSEQRSLRVNAMGGLGGLPSKSRISVGQSHMCPSLNISPSCRRFVERMSNLNARLLTTLDIDGDISGASVGCCWYQFRTGNAPHVSHALTQAIGGRVKLVHRQWSRSLATALRAAQWAQARCYELDDCTDSLLALGVTVWANGVLCRTY